MSDFIMQIGADLDLSKVQEQLNSIKNQKVTLDVEIKGNDDAHNLAKSIEKGLKATKIDTSGLSKQLADAFNITDKSAISKLKSQINSVMSELSKTWNGKEFNLQGGKGNAFISGLSDLANSVAENANIIQGKMGIYDEFYNYFKNKKIYISDDLKKALSGDDYKELLNNNIGHIVKDASKGVSIDSIWGEMTSMFPEHFADNITNQADQIKRAFEVLAQARQDMTQVISAQDMSPEQAAGIKSDAFDNVIAMANQMREKLQQNIESASEEVKNTYDLDVDINTEKIVSDIRNAIQSATGSEDAVKINVKINDEELLSQMRSAISQLATGDEPVQVDIQVNKQSLESDLEVALKDVELPVKFKIDSEQMAADIQAAVNQITDVEINLRVNTDSLRSSVEGAVNSGGNSVPTIDTSGYAEMQNIINGLNNAGVQGQSVFQSFGNTLKDAFSTFTAANLLTGKKIDSTGMSGSQKKKADDYNKAVTNKTKANKKATSAKSKLSTAKSNYNSSNSTYKSMKSNVNEALTAYDSGDSLSYMNSLVDQQVSGKKLEQDARKTAVEQANANLATTKKQKTTANKKLAKLQKKYKNSKTLTAAQRKKMAAGKEIDTTGITDARQLKILTAYNNALADSKKKKENVTIATNALAEANENLMTAEVESAQATVEAVSTKFDNAKTYYEALLSYQEQLSKYQEKNIDLAKSHGDYEKSSDYDTKISNTQAERAIKQNELDELTKQLNDGVEAGTIVENSQEWLDMVTQIKDAENAVADYDTQIEELKQSQIGVYYAEQFERAAEKVDRFRDKLDGLKSLISDDMKIDKNTGLLTESGALSITLDVDDINASTENLKTYIKERQQIINDYNAGKFGEDEYNQKLKDVDSNIKSTTANIYSSRNSILELVKSQSQAELDVLNKVIDKRKEALSAKKNYYDYDKTLKNKTKDIEVLERQIAALEGSTSAEDKARKAKLQEQLQSAKDDLNDTIVDHAYSMQTDSLDKLSTDMSEDLDKWINTISSNMEEMTTAINDAVKNAGLSTAGTINAISSILRHYGLSDSEISQSGLTNITGYASGTDYVPKSGMYRVNENGMESVFSKQYGTLTFLNQGDKVFDANFTKQLLDNSTIATQKNMPDYAGMAKAIEKNIQNIQNLSGNTYVNNFYIDGAQDTESILREIDKHLDKKIQAHDKKQVRDFKSLR